MRMPKIFARRGVQAFAVGLLGIVLMAAADPSTRFARVGHQMMCVCGCNQVLLECNHVGCPDSSRMIGELQAQIANGSADTAVLNWFAAKYGPTVLGAPIRGGFDRVAWIAPFAVFLLATVGTALLVRRFSGRKTVAVAGVPVGEADVLRERIRKETEY